MLIVITLASGDAPPLEIECGLRQLVVQTRRDREWEEIYRASGRQDLADEYAAKQRDVRAIDFDSLQDLETFLHDIWPKCFHPNDRMRNEQPSALFEFAEWWSDEYRWLNGLIIADDYLS